MKKIIRKGVFESNSSSSHSISIVNKEKDVLRTFPRNSEYCIRLQESDIANGDELYTVTHKLISEVAKAQFILNIIATYIDYNEYKYPEVAYWIDHENHIKNDNRNFETLIKQKPFVWFKEVLEEETGSKFEFEKPYDNNYGYPYYLYACDSDYGLESIFKCDWQDEKSFKDLMRNIVFNDNVVIIDSDKAYCDDGDGHEEEIM